MWDLRQSRQVHFFRAHEQAVKCIAIDPNEEFFVTGSISGDIKVELSIRCLQGGAGVYDKLSLTFSWDFRSSK